MLEIAFDKNDNDEFLNQRRQVVEITDIECKTFTDYWKFANQILSKYEKEQIIIIRNSSVSFSSNIFAVALFVSSCLNQTKTECVVFKVEDHKKALQSYKPYVALTIALKYAIRLYNLPVNEAYKEIANMSYLGIDIKINYQDKIISMSLNNKEQGADYIGNDIEQAIISAATLKAFALMQIKSNYTAQIYQNVQNTTVDINNIILQIVKNVSSEL